MKVWVVQEELTVNEEPRIVGVFSSLDECSEGIKAFVAEMYDTVEEADSEIEAFEARLVTVDEKYGERSEEVLPERADFDTRGSRITPP